MQGLNPEAVLKRLPHVINGQHGEKNDDLSAVGLLLLHNRMEPDGSPAWGPWVTFLVYRPKTPRKPTQLMRKPSVIARSNLPERHSISGR